MNNKLIIHLTEIRNLPLITLEAIVQKLKGQALLVICLLSILPFMQPIPLPGLSTLLGFVVLLQGIGLIFWENPLLTPKMKTMVITPERFEQIFKLAEKFIRFTNKISVLKHPWTNSKASHVVCGIAIIISASFLSLPLPIPLSNFIPSISIALICVGLLEEDILLIVMGLGISLTVLWMSLLSYHILRDQIQNFF